MTVIGKRTVRISSGHALAVTVGLNPAGPRLLGRFGKLRVLLVVAMRRHGLAETLTTRTFTLRGR